MEGPSGVYPCRYDTVIWTSVYFYFHIWGLECSRTIDNWARRYQTTLSWRVPESPACPHPPVFQTCMLLSNRDNKVLCILLHADHICITKVYVRENWRPWPLKSIVLGTNNTGKPLEERFLQSSLGSWDFGQIMRPDQFTVGLKERNTQLASKGSNQYLKIAMKFGNWVQPKWSDAMKWNCMYWSVNGVNCGGGGWPYMG